MPRALPPYARYVEFGADPTTGGNPLAVLYNALFGAPRKAANPDGTFTYTFAPEEPGVIEAAYRVAPEEER